MDERRETSDEPGVPGIEIEHEAEAVQSALDVLEAALTAHCVAREEHAVIIVRQGDFEYRRLIGPHGVLTPPDWLGDGQLLAWHQARADLNEPQVLAIEQIIRDAQAAGEKVALCPPDTRTHAVRVSSAQDEKAKQNREALYGSPCGARPPEAILVADEPEVAVVGVASQVRRGSMITPPEPWPRPKLSDADGIVGEMAPAGHESRITNHSPA